jgi:DegV family protein with EDD domain
VKDYVIFTDSCVDLSPEMAAELDIQVENLTFNLDGTVYSNWLDGREISFHDFYAQLRGGGLSSTSQVNATAFVEAFTPWLERGCDVLYLGFSSGLSGTVNGARLAVDELAGRWPDSRLVVVDTLAASMGQGLLVWHAAQLKKQGRSLEEVRAWCEENKLNLAHWFTVDDLHFLKRGGRLSGAAALLGTMFNIKPVLHVDNEGRLIAMEKVRGRRQSLLALVNRMEKTAIDPGGQTVFISHGDAAEDADFVADEIRRRFGTKDIRTNYIGPVIGSHSGPGTIALFFLGTGR